MSCFGGGFHQPCGTRGGGFEQHPHAGRVWSERHGSLRPNPAHVGNSVEGGFGHSGVLGRLLDPPVRGRRWAGFSETVGGGVDCRSGRKCPLPPGLIHGPDPSPPPALTWHPGLRASLTQLTRRPLPLPPTGDTRRGLPLTGAPFICSYSPNPARPRHTARTLPRPPTTPAQKTATRRSGQTRSHLWSATLSLAPLEGRVGLHLFTAGVSQPNIFPEVLRPPRSFRRPSDLSSLRPGMRVAVGASWFLSKWIFLH